MAQRRENSVLIALRELRGVEDSRVATEEQKRRDAAEQARLQAEDSAQRKRDEEQRVRQEAQDVERAKVEAVERMQREERMHAQAVENKARVDAQMVVDQERMRLEMGVRAEEAHRKKPVGLIVAAILLLVVIAGLGVFVMNQQTKDAEQAALLVAQEKENERIKKESAAMVQEAEAQVIALQASKSARGKLLRQIDNTTDPAELKRLFALVAKEKQKEVAAQRHLKEVRRKQEEVAKRRRKKRQKSGPKCDPSDPLCGI